MAGSQYVTGTDRPEGRQYPNSPRSHFTEALADDVANLETAVDAVEADMSTAQGDIDNLETAVDAVEADVATAQDDIDAVELDVADHETRIAELENPGP